MRDKRRRALVGTWRYLWRLMHCALHGHAFEDPWSDEHGIVWHTCSRCMLRQAVG